MTTPSRLYPGDLVEVKSPEQILQTLDSQGTVDLLPFMPEMAQFCGQHFKVFRRVVKTCSSGTRSTMRAFRADDVVILENLRCSGAAHDGCQKACMIFWREVWLQKVQDATVPTKLDATAGERLRARLKT